MQLKQTQGNNGKEFLEIEIFRNHNKRYVYNIWTRNCNDLLGQLEEDDILKVLSSTELRKFANGEQNIFEINTRKLNKIITKPKTND